MHYLFSNERVSIGECTMSEAPHIKWKKDEVIAAHYLHLAGYTYRQIAAGLNAIRPLYVFGCKRPDHVTLHKIQCQVLAYRKSLGE